MGEAPADRPPLVLVGGAPGSGKTTLARRLAAELRLPLLARDDLKEVLLDSLGAPDVARSRELGSASYALLYAVAGRLLAAGVGAVVESNFRRGQSEAGLRPMVGRARATLVLTEVGPEELARRYAGRFARGERHPGHHDGARLPEVLAGFAAGDYAPLDLGIPCLRVDTADGYDPPLAAVLAWVRAGGGREDG